MTAEPADQVSLLRGKPGEPRLLVRRVAGAGTPVLYVHGATFPSVLSAGYRFHGRSWLDDLAAFGFDAWAFDFAGYGGSDRYDDNGMHGRAPEAAEQIARVVDHVGTVTAHPRVAIIAHSWGTIPAGVYAAHHPERIAALCLFGPVTAREMPDMPDPNSLPGSRVVTVAEQLARFVEDVPLGHPPVLIEPALEHWGPAYLATDPDAATRNPHSVKIPNGPSADIAAAWSGSLAYWPEDIRVPTLIVRGEWDSVTSDTDARWLLSRIAGERKHDAKIPKGTHLMHLERSREGLFAAVRAFLGVSP